MRRAVAALALTVALAVAARAGLSDCDPLDPSRCALPFPNNFWLRQNAAGDMRVQFGPNTLPADFEGVGIDPVAGGWNALDGFSGLGAMMTYLGSVSLANVPPYYNISRYAEPDCPLVLLDTVTGARVPVWAELDHSSDEKGNATNAYERLFMAWPAARLVGGRRYIFALRNLVDEYTGLPVNTSYAFTCLRDGIPTTDPYIELRRALFADIFQRLSAAGVQQSELQLAWDFTVATTADQTNKLTFIRDDAFARIDAAGGVQYKVVGVQNNVSADTARFITVELQIPQYVNTPWPGAHFVLDAQGVPVYQGVSTVWVDIYIPSSVANFEVGVTPSVLQYGHGLFGDRSEASSGYLQSEANEFGYVVVASDWIGLSEEDVPSVALMLMSNLTDFKIVPDRCQQGMLHALVLMRFMSQQNWLSDPAMQFPGANGQMTSVLTPNHDKFYFGNSQGGILGTVYMAVTTDVTRGCSGVGGGPYSLMLPRSADFTDLFDGMKLRFPNTLDRMLILGVLQQLWDRADPSGYAAHITGVGGDGHELLPNTPAHDIIFQHGLGDAQVSYIGVQTLARSVGATMFVSNVNEPNEQYFGFPYVGDDSAAHTAHETTWRFPNVPPVPEWNVPPLKKTDTHEGPRRQYDAQQQMFVFFTSGDILNFCGGPCNGGPFDAPHTANAKLF